MCEVGRRQGSKHNDTNPLSRPCSLSHELVFIFILLQARSMHSMAYYYVAMNTTRSSLHNLVCIVDLLASMRTVLVVVRMHSLFIYYSRVRARTMDTLARVCIL